MSISSYCVLTRKQIRNYRSLLTVIRKCSSSRLKSEGVVEIQLSNNRIIELSSGKLARFADGSCIGKSGDTSAMVTAVSRKTSVKGASFVPLTVDYRQKAAAAGRIPTNFLRREMGPSEKEILTSRMVDRSLRPMFPDGYFYDTQIVCNLLAVDGVNDPDVLAINAASAALAVSDIPWNGPIGAVRVGLIDDEVVVNPTRRESQVSILDLLVAGTESKNILMMEGSAKEPVLMNYMTKALKRAAKEIGTIVRGIKLLQKSVGKPKRESVLYVPSAELLAAIESLITEKLGLIYTNYTHDKISRDTEMQALRVEVAGQLADQFPDLDTELFQNAFSKLQRKIYANVVSATEKRCDGRSYSEMRPITCDVDLYKPLHGSAIFQRGQTQVFCSVAFDSQNSVLKSDPISILTGGLKEKHFMLHYEFPAYATNEIGRGTAFGRREIGHGALAEKALRPIVPEDFPFAIRLSCEVLESNGSSSMASICAGSLALMDAGVPIPEAASGVALGLIYPEGSEEPIILTDIIGMEDYLGEMDFKVGGTKRGFTALQLDVKNEGIPSRVIMSALQKGHEAKLHIFSKMNEAISEPRTLKKENWPVSSSIEVPPHKRSQFLGFGGQNLKRVMAETGVQVTQDPENVNKYIIFAPSKQAMEEASELIEKSLTVSQKEPEFDFGGIYAAKVVEVREHGVMVTLHPNMTPVLLHLKELDTRKVQHPSALGIEVGQEFQVKYFGRDPVNGQVRLSRRVLQMMNPKIKNFLPKEESS
ncbi:Polyribonucleotide nucleotidyltransferase 1, mitochondrial [Halotydeus destructor]|nr:Polyribonucleotide nucleotidyltransferase 1, mitochondrial [Halotydeus destructor]